MYNIDSKEIPLVGASTRSAIWP